MSLNSLKESIQQLLEDHKLLDYSNDLHDDSTVPSCKCGHLLADDSIEEHQAELIVIAASLSLS